LTHRGWVLLALSSIPLVMTLGNSTLIPVIPIIQRQLTLSPLQASLIITVYSIVAVPLIPIAGFLSDRIGRKAVIIPSLILAGLGGMTAGFAAVLLTKPYNLILAARMLQGVGAAGAFPLVLPLTRDLFLDENEVSHALGLVETANTFGKVLSPMLGAYLAGISWLTPFFAIPVLVAVSLSAIILFVGKPAKEQDSLDTGLSLKQLKVIFQKEGRWLVAVYLTGCIIMLLLFGIQFYIAEVLEGRSINSNVSRGLILAIPLAGLCLASYLTGKFLGDDKSQMKWTALSGMAILSITCAVMAYCQNLTLLITILTLGFCGIGTALPSLDALITENIAKEHNGTVTSIFNSMRFIGVAAGPPAFALLMRSHKSLFLTASGIALLAVVLIGRLIKTGN